MNYIVLNSHIVCLNEIRNAYKYFDSIYIDFKNGLSFFAENNKMFEINSNEASFVGALRINKTIYYGDRMEYRPAYDMEGNLIGYDLYVE